MVRVKASPFKSLEEIDYTHPSVVFWFFGQTPPRTSKKASASSLNTHSTSTTRILDKGVSPPSKETNGKIVHASPPLSGHISPIDGSSTPLSTSPSANSQLPSPDAEALLQKSLKDDPQKGKKGDNKRSKIIKVTDKFSISFSFEFLVLTPSRNQDSILRILRTCYSPYYHTNIILASCIFYISFRFVEKRFLCNWPHPDQELPPTPVEQRPGKQNLHPLANHPDITPLNDLQSKSHFTFCSVLWVARHI